MPRLCNIDQFWGQMGAQNIPVRNLESWLPLENIEQPPKQNRTRLKILIADDERTIADTLAIILRQSGFETDTVYDGHAAVEKARHWKPNLLLSDVMMPGINGIEAAIRVCKLIPECRVLLFSGHTMTADLLDDARVQGHHFEVLQKPIHPAELLARLARSSDTCLLHAEGVPAELSPQCKVPACRPSTPAGAGTMPGCLVCWRFAA